MNGVDPLAELLRRAPVGARLDSNRLNRYSLTRKIADDFDGSQANRPILFCGYNPSTADETTDDRTLRREIAFARDLGGTYLVKVNLLSQRATKPEKIDIAEAERSFDENVTLVTELAALTLRAGGKIIAAWGIPKGRKKVRALAAKAENLLTGKSELVGQWQTFGLTGNGHPRHPLYLPKTAWKNLIGFAVPAGSG
ncbi:MAG: DUF1643 domain-containing protein [Gammaproteobacteria bacterium]|nr:DUF1643 domain-containing protein [Gammaproteobacteria bacterium]MYL14491.1 DUF1643 domain-containing protein [Gammaproteobacteria bacterium]